MAAQPQAFRQFAVAAQPQAFRQVAVAAQPQVFRQVAGPAQLVGRPAGVPAAVVSTSYSSPTVAFAY